MRCEYGEPKTKWVVRHIEEGELQHTTYHDKKESAQEASEKWMEGAQNDSP